MVSSSYFLRNYHYSPRNNPEQRGFQLLHDRSLKSHIVIRCSANFWQVVSDTRFEVQSKDHNQYRISTTVYTKARNTICNHFGVILYNRQFFSLLLDIISVCWSYLHLPCDLQPQELYLTSINSPWCNVRDFIFSEIA